MPDGRSARKAASTICSPTMVSHCALPAGSLGYDVMSMISDWCLPPPRGAGEHASVHRQDDLALDVPPGGTGMCLGGP